MTQNGSRVCAIDEQSFKKANCCIFEEGILTQQCWPFDRTVRGPENRQPEEAWPGQEGEKRREEQHGWRQVESAGAWGQKRKR